jgi:glycosyltransferase involved in cell wall biosynthesis
VKIFLVLSAAPVPDGEAVEVVAYEVARHAVEQGHEVAVQVILREPRGSANSLRAERALERLALERTRVCPALYLSDVTTPTSRGGSPWERGRRLLASFGADALFPATRLGPAVASRVHEWGAEAILSVWSWEGLAATHAIAGVPKLIYYGNPDHLPIGARLRHPTLFGLPCASGRERVLLALERLRNRRRRQLNVAMMRRCEITANNSMLDARFYAAHGHPRSIYLQNMWPPIPEAPTTPRSGDGVIRIIGSVGNLGATGNTFGLSYLGRDLLPRLKARFGARPFEVHVLGKGAPSLAVAPFLDDPHIVRRGWVDDIDAEIRGAHGFLVLTNVSDDFLVGNTRILLAWALRACVIAHTNSALAMPELAHDENVLLGRTPDEIAALIARAAEDAALRERIGRGGFDTFQAYYRSDMVVPRMLALLEEVARR